MEPNCEQVEKGKTRWPELVGVKGEIAAATIERENPLVKAEIILDSPETVILAIFICDRVYVWVDENGITTRVPFNG